MLYKPYTKQNSRCLFLLAIFQRPRFCEIIRKKIKILICSHFSKQPTRNIIRPPWDLWEIWCVLPIKENLFQCHNSPWYNYDVFCKMSLGIFDLLCLRIRTPGKSLKTYPARVFQKLSFTKNKSCKILRKYPFAKINHINFERYVNLEEISLVKISTTKIIQNLLVFYTIVSVRLKKCK